MGGWGSGRKWAQNKKVTTEDYRRIDIRHWQRNGLLSPGKRFIWQWTFNYDVIGEIRVFAEQDQMTLKYRQQLDSGEWKDHCYSVNLTWTPCRFGGRRVWAKCPAAGCGRRVAVLYGGGIFACRQCRQLAYPSQRETAGDRAARSAEKLRERFGWPGSIFDGSGAPPKGMHERTFKRLFEKYERAVGECLADARRRFGINVDS